VSSQAKIVLVVDRRRKVSVTGTSVALPSHYRRIDRALILLLVQNRG
jgi:hypothetical protein